VEIEFELLTGPTPVTARVESTRLSREFGPFTLSPPRKWTVYLTQHTNADMAFPTANLLVIECRPAAFLKGILLPCAKCRPTRHRGEKGHQGRRLKQPP